MNTLTELVAPELTPAEFKKRVISFIKSKEFKPELIRQLLMVLPDDKHKLMENYRVDTITDAINSEKSEWVCGGYFFDSPKWQNKIFV
ncbi:hypothetical protein HR45_13635 [Shewanella mangrovi]|uniref:Uncharacterized protein n=1 Tax=Shewanella mangrovi TaxID=1515746 RepID=A0A094JCC1_9GAMM|nr:hypothetical protein [Shewanella mangrovi]KFZ36842.1 hypothetical protein HR45_13635 [Shewanella mangrovi]